MVRHPTPEGTHLDEYAEGFTRARMRLERWMRGDPLDVSALASDLKRLPDNVCQTLLRGLPRQLSNEVLAAVRQLRHAGGEPRSAS